MNGYEKPRITDIGDLRELTQTKPKFGPMIPAHKGGGGHHGGCRWSWCKSSTRTGLTTLSGTTTHW
jgi:hypothetical protein